MWNAEGHWCGMLKDTDVVLRSKDIDKDDLSCLCT